MKARPLFLLTLSSCLISTGSLFAEEKTQPREEVIIPDSSIEHPGDAGKRAHTNHVILLRRRPAFTNTAPGGETPASLACVYKTAPTLTPGCPILGTTALPTGGSETIAIVDAFDYPTAQNDFDVFSKQFGLPLSTDNVCNGANPCFQKVYASGVQPRADCGWSQEAALDIEWAHAMAPHAQIVLVEADSSSLFDLFTAVDVASSIVSGPTGLGSGEVSMSWGASEFSFETLFDIFLAPASVGGVAPNGVVFFAASGDTGGHTIWPGVSPYVVSAGGTTINRLSGNFQSETGWSGSGGGRSTYESRPHYQDILVKLVGSHRGSPDFSFDSDPHSGVSVYDSTPCNGLSGWLVFGGTSVSAQALAGIVNLAGHFHTDTDTELSTIYANYSSSNYHNDFRDIVSGTAGSFHCTVGWDFVTGVGSDQGTAGK